MLKLGIFKDIIIEIRYHVRRNDLIDTSYFIEEIIPLLKDIEKIAARVGAWVKAYTSWNRYERPPVDCEKTVDKSLNGIFGGILILIVNPCRPRERLYIPNA